MRVLQVEDDTATAQAVEQMLQSKGYDCETTGFGVEAVAMANKQKYDVILLDVMLPDIDGYEVLRQLQAAEINTPVLIQSGLVGRDEVDKGQGFGVEDFLIKPFTKSELTDRIEAIVSRANDNIDDAKFLPDDEYDRRDDTREEDDIRRESPRIKTLKSGQIVFNNSTCSVDCLILNMSDGGAAIQPTDAHDLPRTFLLKILNGPTQQCEVCWRYENKLGVRFLASEDGNEPG